MGNGTRRRARRWSGAALQAAACLALVGGVPARSEAAPGASDDPCRFATAEAIGKAFGRPMKSSKLVNVCQYQGSGTDVVIIKVEAGPEGTILRHAKSASAQSAGGAEKVKTAVGEAYFDSTMPVFIGRVGNQEVQIETTIQPLPRDAMIAVGTRIMESLARK